MLKITIGGIEYYDEAEEEFKQVPEYKLQLEHSLVSISKWESRNKKPYLDNDTKMTVSETIDYVRCMNMTQNIPDDAFNQLSRDNIVAINDYINDPMTATTFGTPIKQTGLKTGDKEIIKTSEQVYYLMQMYGIPHVCEKWHFNRLMTLIKIHDIKNSPKTKMSRSEIIEENRRRNEERKKKYNTKG